MTSQARLNLFRMVADRDMTGLETLVDATTDRLDRQHVRNGIAHVRRALLPALERDFLDRHDLSTADGVELSVGSDVIAGPVPPPIADPIQDAVADVRAHLWAHL